LLIYDWSWWAIDVGIGETSLIGFWDRIFGSPIFIPQLPMWFFLLISILGGIMAFYTFTIPKTYWELLPPTIWLYAVYPNASICSFIGLREEVILLIGICLAVLSFAIALYYAFTRLKQEYPRWKIDKSKIKEDLKIENWRLDPLASPLIYLILTMIALMHLFLLLLPVVGIYFGFISWMLIPLIYVLFKGSSAKRFKKPIQLYFALFIVIFLVAIMLFMHLYSL
jgi:hypothetical protein